MSPRQTAKQNGDMMFIQFCKFCDKDNEHYVSGGCICRRGRKNSKEAHSKSRLKCDFNMTPEDWLRMYNKQGGKCLITSCNYTHHAEWWDQGRGGFHVHHSHDTGEVIGLLCPSCNKAEGHINKDLIRTQELIDMKYLHENKKVVGIMRGTAEATVTGTKSKEGVVTWSEPTIIKTSRKIIWQEKTMHTGSFKT